LRLFLRRRCSSARREARLQRLPIALLREAGVAGELGVLSLAGLVPLPTRLLDAVTMVLPVLVMVRGVLALGHCVR